MKVVIDTNVFISGIFWSGPPADILKAWYRKAFILCFTPSIRDEYSRVAYGLAKKYSDIDVAPYLELIPTYSEMVADRKLPEPVSRDPDDDKFIACALSANAKVIISGDQDLLSIGSYKGINIVTPKIFLS